MYNVIDNMYLNIMINLRINQKLISFINCSLQNISELVKHYSSLKFLVILRYTIINVYN